MYPAFGLELTLTGSFFLPSGPAGPRFTGTALTLGTAKHTRRQENSETHVNTSSQNYYRKASRNSRLDAYTTMSEKRHPTHVYNFAKYWSIFKVFSLLHHAQNLLQNGHLCWQDWDLD